MLEAEKNAKEFEKEWDKPEIRPLTREEQLNWLIPFIEGRIKLYREELKGYKDELKKIKVKKK